MSAQEPNCLYVTSDRAAADLIVTWLYERNIAAEVVTHLKESDGLMVTPFANSDMSNHLEIHLKDINQRETAEQLLANHQEELLQIAQKLDDAPAADMVVVCDSCGQSSVYAGEFQGTVQDCQHCGSYLDVPGGEDEYDWSAVEETLEEDADADDDDEDEDDE